MTAQKYFLLGLLFQTTTCSAFAPTLKSKSSFHQSGPLNLVPISSFTDASKRTFLTASDSYRKCLDEEGKLRSDDDGNPYIICVAEEDDLPSISQLTIDAFGADAITLSKDLSPLEQSLINPGVSAFNAYSNLVAFTDVLSGLRQRMKHRIGNSNDGNKDHLLNAPPVKSVNDVDAKDVAAKSSVILALAREKPDGNDIEAIATVELRLQPTDCKIPFSQPWFDQVERSLATMLNMNVEPKDLNLQPYLSNLCVDESARGRQIGKAMVRCVEKIAKDAWGYEKIYLHVDLENVAALNLYKTEGYEDVGARWNPFWAGEAADIGYYVKNL